MGRRGGRTGTGVVRGGVELDGGEGAVAVGVHDEGLGVGVDEDDDDRGVDALCELRLACYESEREKGGGRTTIALVWYW